MNAAKKVKKRIRDRMKHHPQIMPRPTEFATTVGHASASAQLARYFYELPAAPSDQRG